jgi:hypothetical protein
MLLYCDGLVLEGWIMIVSVYFLLSMFLLLLVDPPYIYEEGSTERDRKFDKFFVG